MLLAPYATTARMVDNATENMAGPPRANDAFSYHVWFPVGYGFPQWRLTRGNHHASNPHRSDRVSGQLSRFAAPARRVAKRRARFRLVASPSRRARLQPAVLSTCR